MRNDYVGALDWIDRALGVAGADVDPSLRARSLCRKTWCLWALGRGDELHTVMDEAEVVAREVASPELLSYVLRTRAAHELSDRPDAAAALADEALHWASVADDDWAFAIAAQTRALASADAAELRERVDWAATLLQQAGNLYILADLLVPAPTVRCVTTAIATRTSRRPRDPDRTRTCAPKQLGVASGDSRDRQARRR